MKGRKWKITLQIFSVVGVLVTAVKGIIKFLEFMCSLKPNKAAAA
jgi:hypothetical protein